MTAPIVGLSRVPNASHHPKKLSHFVFEHRQGNHINGWLYRVEARVAKIQGTIVLEAVFHIDGTVTVEKVITGPG